MTDLAMGQDHWQGSRYPAYSGWDSQYDTGRHAFNEDAALTPIFHALTSGGWQERQHEPAAVDRGAGRYADPVDEFHRDPLTAPIPVQAMAAVPAQSLSRSESRLRSVHERRRGVEDSGRHRRRLESAWHGTR